MRTNHALQGWLAQPKVQQSQGGCYNAAEIWTAQTLLLRVQVQVTE